MLVLTCNVTTANVAKEVHTMWLGRSTATDLRCVPKFA